MAPSIGSSFPKVPNLKPSCGTCGTLRNLGFQQVPHNILNENKAEMENAKPAEPQYRPYTRGSKFTHVCVFFCVNIGDRK